MTNDGWKAPVAFAVIAMIGVVGPAIVANWAHHDPSGSPSPHGPNASPPVAVASSSAPTTSTTPTPTPRRPTATPAPLRVAVANVYNLPQSEGVDKIRAQGFTSVRPVPVCSSSVGPGRIRQVIVDNGSAIGKETILVDKGGSTGVKVRLATKLEVKVGNGSSCSP